MSSARRGSQAPAGLPEQNTGAAASDAAIEARRHLVAIGLRRNPAAANDRSGSRGV